MRSRSMSIPRVSCRWFADRRPNKAALRRGSRVTLDTRLLPVERPAGPDPRPARKLELARIPPWLPDYALPWRAPFLFANEPGFQSGSNPRARGSRGSFETRRQLRLLDVELCTPHLARRSDIANPRNQPSSIPRKPVHSGLRDRVTRVRRLGDRALSRRRPAGSEAS